MNQAFAKFDLSGRTALITGGGTGLGLEMTRALALSGAQVMIAARRVDVLERAAEQLNAECAERRVCFHPVDLTQRESVKVLADHALSVFNGVDIFIGNAGVEQQQPIDDITPEALDRQIMGGLTANIELTRDLLPHMRRKRWGRIILSSSAASLTAVGDDMISVYGTVKSGLNSFARYVAAEAGHDGITANALIIGCFLTDMVQAHMATLDEAARGELAQAFSAMVFLRRPGRPEEIAGLVQLLASEAGSYITGACIPIDGGITAAFRPTCRPAPLPV